MKNRHELEFRWRPSSTRGEDAEILTHILESHYCQPAGLDFEEPLKNPAVTPVTLEAMAQVWLLLIVYVLGLFSSPFCILIETSN
jgi:hypothetical protein